MYKGMAKDIAADKFDPMGLFEERLDRVVGPNCKLPAKYVGPSDEVTSREP